MQRVINIGNTKQLYPVFWTDKLASAEVRKLLFIKNEVVMGQWRILIGFRDNSPPVKQVIHFWRKVSVNYKMPIALRFLCCRFSCKIFFHSNGNCEKTLSRVVPFSLLNSSWVVGSLRAGASFKPWFWLRCPPTILWDWSRLMIDSTKWLGWR